MKTIPISSTRSYRPAHLFNHIKPRGCLHCKSSWSHFCVCSRLWSGGCLSITPASWKTVHHTPHGTQPSQLEGPAAPTGGVNETGATCQPPQLNWTKVGNQSPLPQQLPAHEGTQTCDPQWQNLLRMTKSDLQSSEKTRKVIKNTGVSEGSFGNREERTYPNGQQGKGVSLH